MNDKLIVSIDAGTTNIKCGLYDISFRQIACAEEKNSLIEFEDGRIEQDMNLLWSVVCKTINELITKNEVDPANIAALGLTGQGEGFWAIDSSGSPVRPAILWCDNRAGKVAEGVAQNALLSDLYRNNTGSFPFAGAQMIILKWLKENEPETLEKAETVFFCKDWIRYKLTSEASTEYTDASTSVLDLNKKNVAEGLFEALDINHVIKKIPEFKKSYDIAGCISEKAALETGLEAGIPVVAGLIDIAATALGAGAVNVGDCCTILGTTTCNEVITENIDVDSNNVAGYEIDALNSNYLNVLASMSGTGNIDWYIKEIDSGSTSELSENQMPEFEELEQEIVKIDVGSGGLIYHPYISAAGERSPFIDVNAKAQFFGISAHTTKYHLLRAIYEGVAYSIRDNLEATTGVKNIFLAGGGARSRLWAQIISDVSGKKVFLIEDSDPTARGAALVAGIGAGFLDDLDSIKRNAIVMTEEIQPDKSRYKVYSEFYDIYLQLRKQNKDLWSKRKKILKGTGVTE